MMLSMQAIFFLVVLLHMTNANDVVQILLNNGKDYYCTDRWNNCCTTSEWDLITRSVYTMSMNQRHSRALRGKNGTDYYDEDTIVDETDTARFDSSSISANDANNRELRYRRYCPNNCRGYTIGKCMALNCYGYRQRRSMLQSIRSLLLGNKDVEKQQMSQLQQEKHRTLFWATGCDNQKSEINNLLNNIQHQVGGRCRSLLNAPRNLTCYSNIDC